MAPDAAVEASTLGPLAHILRNAMTLHVAVRRRWVATLAFIAVAAFAPEVRRIDPLVYTIRFPDPASRTFTVELIVPTGKRAAIDLMMPVWSPGFYGLQNYADRVTAFAAQGDDHTRLEVTKSAPNRWSVATRGRGTVVVTYTVSAPRGSNLSNGVTPTSAVLIGPATYVTLVEKTPRPAEVRLELPSGWAGSMSSLDVARGGNQNHYVAPDYDVLADSPILAGADLTTTPFTVRGLKHYWTYLGKVAWDARVW